MQNKEIFVYIILRDLLIYIRKEFRINFMKATGIVRRIDDLGRVVIPKEIRKTMRIREGDPLEIYTDRDGEVIFKKYSPIGEMQLFAAEYAETLAKTAGMSIFVCDRDAIIAVAGASKREYLDRKISKGLEEIIEGRAIYKRDYGKEPFSVIADKASHYISCAMPILAEGDIVGCILSGLQYDISADDKISDEIESKLIQTAGIFLGKQMEG